MNIKKTGNEKQYLKVRGHSKYSRGHKAPKHLPTNSTLGEKLKRLTLLKSLLLGLTVNKITGFVTSTCTILRNVKKKYTKIAVIAQVIQHTPLLLTEMKAREMEFSIK